jgi:hypothetical protein
MKFTFDRRQHALCTPINHKWNKYGTAWNKRPTSKIPSYWIQHPSQVGKIELRSKAPSIQGLRTIDVYGLAICRHFCALWHGTRHSSMHRCTSHLTQPCRHAYPIRPICCVLVTVLPFRRSQASQGAGVASPSSSSQSVMGRRNSWVATHGSAWQHHALYVALS